MRKGQLRDRFLLSFIVLMAVSWLLGLLSPALAIAGPFIAGMVFVRFRAGVERRSVANGAGTAGAAIGLMMVPVLAVVWFVLTATSGPGDSENLLEALIDFESNSDRARNIALFTVGVLLISAAGGALAAWLHQRQLDGSYWTTDE